MQDDLATVGRELTGRLVFPDGPDYESARLGWARQLSRFPLVIVFCQNVQDVVNALCWCREREVAFRARSGRHALEGWSSVDGGVIIDVSEMDRIQVDESAGVATVQTGATQGAVMEALGKRGYTIPSGGEKTPGIGGVTLGGGIGWLSRSMGLACDHLVGLETVIPSGKQGARVIQADEHDNADLLWASRGGGGGNFGIATSYTFKLCPTPDVVFYEVTWGERDWHHLGELLGVWQELAPAASDGLGSVFFASSEAAGTITTYGVFTGSEEERLRRLLQPLLGIGKPEVTFETIPYLDAWLRIAGSPEDDPPRKDKFSSVWVYSSLPPEAIGTVRRFLEDAPNPSADIWCLSWGGAVGRVPTDATAFYHRKPRYYIEWDISWEEASEEKEVVAWTERFRMELGPYVEGSYINVPDRGINDLRTYYGDNLARLQEVKRKYDPGNVFHFEQSIPPGGDSNH
jgi:FAD/FMN-containing dehydrogenase